MILWPAPFGIVILYEGVDVAERQVASRRIRRCVAALEWPRSCDVNSGSSRRASGAAVSTLLKIMVDGTAPHLTRVRAADSVLAHAPKSIEIEDIEVRVADIERNLEASKQGCDPGSSRARTHLAAQQAQAIGDWFAHRMASDIVS